MLLSGQNGPGPDGRNAPLRAPVPALLITLGRLAEGRRHPSSRSRKTKGHILQPPWSRAKTLIISGNPAAVIAVRPAMRGTLQGALDGLQHPFQPASETRRAPAVPDHGEVRCNWLGNLRFSSCSASRGRPNLFFRAAGKPAAESPRFRLPKCFAC